ncbi:hypothetical protein Fot_04806 [Forsythia ovata]|uniref:Uncharacterized protein n=1 Tax=Forsythia ovata TaxID=205694 RepID=A0ABD1WNB0_9LAMI
MLTKPNNLFYEHGMVDYIDYVDSSILNRQLLDKLVEVVGLDLLMRFLYKKQKLSLLKGLGWSILIPPRPPSPDNINVRKGLVIIDPKTREELSKLDLSKLQCKEKREKKKSKQEEDHMSSGSKRHKSSTSVKLVEIVELSGSESDVPDNKVKEVEEVEVDAMGD